MLLLFPRQTSRQVVSVVGCQLLELVKPPRPEGRAFCLTAALRARGASRSALGLSSIGLIQALNVGVAYQLVSRKKASSNMLILVKNTMR